MDLNIAIKLMAVIAGVVFGSAAISAACWVWLRKQVFAYGGSVLSVSGVVLISMSIYHSVKFGVTKDGLNFQAEAALESARQTLRDANTALVTARASQIRADFAASEAKSSQRAAQAFAEDVSFTIVHKAGQNPTLTADDIKSILAKYTKHGNLDGEWGLSFESPSTKGTDIRSEMALVNSYIAANNAAAASLALQHPYNEIQNVQRLDPNSFEIQTLGKKIVTLQSALSGGDIEAARLAVADVQKILMGPDAYLIDAHIDNERSAGERK